VILTFVVCFFPASKHSIEQLRMPWPGPGLLLGVGLAATAGQLLLTRAFSGGAPARVSVIGLTQIGFAMVFDVVLWDRAVTVHSLIGILMIVGPSIWLMTRRTPENTDEAN
jgi:drug/metabolite transporter (DMT)-like permease